MDYGRAYHKERETSMVKRRFDPKQRVTSMDQKTNRSYVLKDKQGSRNGLKYTQQKTSIGHERKGS